MSPEGTDFVLTTDIPHCETDVFVFHSFDIESNGWNSSDNFTQLQFVQDGGFTSGIESNHQDAHLLLPKHVEQICEHLTHDGRLF
jgi:hypothetical protein